MRVEDILTAIERITRYTSAQDFPAFRADQVRIEAVLYNLVVIGEAARALPLEIAEQYGRSNGTS